MKHLLDNPVYHALRSGNRNLARGTGEVSYFDRNVSPFVGLKENSPSHLRKLAGLLPDSGKRAVMSEGPLEAAPSFKIFEAVPIIQMVYQGSGEKPEQGQKQIRSLGETDIPEMLALTRLTRPGPFDRDTLLFGHYRGIFIDGQLAAMAGQRMHPLPYAEISAVCTHPAFRGMGLAGHLISDQLQRILANHEVPILHVKTDNTPAIRLYSTLGFSERKALTVFILERAAGAVAAGTGGPEEK
jgi:ribosomal protein S18 acetylase RimI-like enzyme